jgi:flagellar assembly protein FliH
MKNSSSSAAASNGGQIPVTSFNYRDMCAPPPVNVEEINHPGRAAAQRAEQAGPTFSQQEVNEQVALARAEAIQETENRLTAAYEAKSMEEATKISEALDQFLAERKSYFSRVESDVVKLSLAIAAKILHREAQVDPLLVAALVRVAVDKLHDGSSVSVRVSPEKAEKWRECLSNSLNGSTITIVEDAHVDADDCILETDLGSANFSIDAQLKEIEQGFFDLLAHRPTVK